MGFGYMGKVLWVDLGTGRMHEEKVPERVYRRYLSGTGLAAYFLYDRIPAGADPLGRNPEIQVHASQRAQSETQRYPA